jgi:tetratricopeptide (TPR) repeat protein
MRDLIAVESRSTKTRLLLAGTVATCLVLCWFAVRWQIGNMLAGFQDPFGPNAAEVAQGALDLAPSDPTAHWLAATAATGEAIQGFESAVRSAPRDLRWRVELARALEQGEMAARAEVEFKSAIALAPAYAYPHWHLANFYLRQGRNDDALAELKKAAENNLAYRDQVFSLVWDIFDKDPAKVEAVAGESTEAKARLAYFFAARGRAADALRNWNLLSEAEKAANPDNAKAIAHGLYLQHYFLQSLEFARQAGLDTEAQPEAVTNGSFEKGLGDDPDSRFGWQVLRNDPKVEFATDAKVKHEGDRGLKVTFRTYVKPALGNLLQTIVVTPGRRYRLTFWIRTENLKSSGGPLLQVVSANDEKLIAQSQPFPTGTNDWQQIAVDFSAPENCGGISIRTARLACGEDCPITGVFWYDDFVLSKQ